MREIDLIHRQLELVAVSVANRVRRIYDALESISYLTKVLLTQSTVTPEAVAQWIERERFEVLPSGFYGSAAHMERLKNKTDDHDATMFWSAKVRDHELLQRRYYILRSVVPHATSLCRQLKAPWVYFQHGLTPHAALVMPAMVPENAVPSDFSWHEYHSFTIASPENNPERAIRWTLPNVDYGGQGLVSCVSKPLYGDDDELLGVWTIDVRLAELHADLALQPVGNVGKRQTNFLTDFAGRLIAHPNLDPSANAEKGSVHNVMLASLDGDFATLDVAALAKQEQGEIELANAEGERLVIAFRAVPEINWVIYASFPKSEMIEATQAAFKQAFDNVGKGDLSLRLDAVADETMQQLVSSYNEMIQALQENLARREQAEAEKRRLVMEQQRELEKKVAERTAELEVAKKAADQASQAKSEFLSSMSHELRTPLNGILGYAQILERSPTLSATDRAGVQVIKKSGDHLLMLINDVLDLAKIEAGRMELVPREFQFASLLKTVSNLSRVRADQKQLAFVQDYRGPVLDRVVADEKRLTQILLNLLGNAIKFTEKGHVALRTEVEATARGNCYKVRFNVEDTGAGIAPEHVSRIFEPFEQVGEETKKSEGTGLGLAITKKIVEQMGGSLSVTSELGQGSTFSVTFELSVGEGDTLQSGDVAWQNVVGYSGERRTILVVDDQPANRAVVRDLLTPLGFIVQEAADGQVALQLVSAAKPAFMLMDIAMPVMDGCEVTRRLRAHYGPDELPIVACSASLSEAKRKETREAGCNDFLAKPIEVGALLGKLSRFLALEWSRPTEMTPPAPTAETTAEIVLPARDVLHGLLEMAKDGRLPEIVEETKRLEDTDARLKSWLRTIRQLADDFEVDNLCARLQSDIDAAT